jgi:hypothetical protein
LQFSAEKVLKNHFFNKLHEIFRGKSFEKSFFPQISRNFPRKITFRGKKCTKNWLQSSLSFFFSAKKVVGTIFLESENNGKRHPETTCKTFSDTPEYQSINLMLAAACGTGNPGSNRVQGFYGENIVAMLLRVMS